MKSTAAIALLCTALFSTGLLVGRTSFEVPEHPDSLRSVYLYTEGIKRLTIDRDSTRARESMLEALRLDSAYAPALFELASNQLYDTPAQGVDYARRAFEQDTTNKWYLQLYGQTLLYAERFDQALDVYRRLLALDAQNPDIYRILTLLYEQREQPFSALAMLDSAELRFGKIPALSAMKRQLLMATRQTDKAIAEAKAMVDVAPYQAEHHVVLGDLYDQTGKDSLALVELRRALEIDSLNAGALMTLSDFYNRRQDYRGLLSTTRQLFSVDAVPLDTKIRRFEQLTSDRNFYRGYYPQINDLAWTLAIRYPRQKQVVDLYAGHLIASGELEQALLHYKLRLEDTPLQEDYFKSVIDIESYLERPDSVNRYVDLALTHFPGKLAFRLSKGHVLVQSKQFPEAVKAYEQTLRLADSDSLRGTIWGFIGDAWHQKAEHDEQARSGRTNRHVDHPGVPLKGMSKAYKAYDRSLRYAPDNVSVLNNYAYFLSEEGRSLERALAMSSRAVALSDNNPTFLDTHAWVLFKLGRAAEARKIMQQVIALDRQNSPELALHYGDILWALGEKFMAQIYWKKALDNGYDAAAIARRLENSNKK